MTEPLEPPGMAEFRHKRRTLFHPQTDFARDAAEAAKLLARNRNLLHEFTPLIKERASLIFGAPADSVEPRPELGALHSIYEIHARGEKWILRPDMLGVHGALSELQELAL